LDGEDLTKPSIYFDQGAVFLGAFPIGTTMAFTEVNGKIKVKSCRFVKYGFIIDPNITKQWKTDELEARWPTINGDDLTWGLASFKNLEFPKLLSTLVRTKRPFVYGDILRINNPHPRYKRKTYKFIRMENGLAVIYHEGETENSKFFLLVNPSKLYFKLSKRQRR